MRLRAHVSTHDGAPSNLDLKAFCASRLPKYMVPDAFVFHATLPRTSTDKVDYVSLAALCPRPAPGSRGAHPGHAGGRSRRESLTEHARDD
jgi:acyl-coenzyme A synthetase/AMP-(fatty) acid ligase